MSIWDIFRSSRSAPEAPVLPPREPESARPARPRRPPRSRPRVDEYYCHNDAIDCLGAFRRDELLFGCYRCREIDHTAATYDELSPDMQAALGTKAELDSLWDRAAPPRCPQHAGLSISAACPRCGGAISRSNEAPPSTIFGGANSGKSVFCAVLVKELDRLYEATGVATAARHDADYLSQVVQPLFDQGVLPNKTAVDASAHRRVVIRAGGADWPQRRYVITDMAGEIWEPAAQKLGADYVKVARGTILYSHDSIFVVDPSKATRGVLNARVPPDLFGVLSGLLGVLQSTSLLHGRQAAELTDLFRRITRILRSEHYPRGSNPQSRTRLARRVLMVVMQATRPMSEAQQEALVGQIEATLESHAGVVVAQAGFAGEIRELVQFLKDHNYQRTPDGRLDHRLAVVISKADLVPDAPLVELSELGAHARSTREQWYAALCGVSDRARAKLEEMGEGQFVASLEAEFTEVGFFFVSSLAADTEVVVRPAPSSGGYEAELGDYRGAGFLGMASADPQPARPSAEWVLDKVVTLGEAGVRTPEPRGILLPLLWQLAGAR